MEFDTLQIIGSFDEPDIESGMPPKYENIYESSNVNRPVIRDQTFFSIFNTLCCCTLIGIPALIFSIRSKERYHFGDYKTARRFSRFAKMFNIIGLIFGTAFFMITFYFEFLIVKNYQNRRRIFF
jgi:hypothetical protein